MQKIVEYTLTGNSTLEGFRSMVSEHIKLGWQPLGGVSVDDGYFYQAMVKYEDDNQTNDQ